MESGDKTVDWSISIPWLKMQKLTDHYQQLLWFLAAWNVDDVKLIAVKVARCVFRERWHSNALPLPNIIITLRMANIRSAVLDVPINLRYIS
jgi:hypothetical protein